MKKALVIGVILLFLGLSVQPSISAHIPDKIEVKLKDYMAHKIREISNKFDVENIHSLLERLQANNPVMQKVITAFIGEYDELNKKIEQLSDLPCNCENDDRTFWWYLNALLCLALLPLFYIGFLIWAFTRDSTLMDIVWNIGIDLNCW